MDRGWLIRLVIVGFCLTSLSAWADPQGPSWSPEFGLEEGLTFGGGDLISSDITHQPSLTPSNVHLYTGDTLFVDAYYRQAIGHTGLSFKVATGLGFSCQIPTCLDLLGNSSGPYQFAPVIGEVALEYAGEGGRIGIGPTGRFLNSLSSTSSVYAFQQVYLKPAYGWFVEYEYNKLGALHAHHLPFL